MTFTSTLTLKSSPKVKIFETYLWEEAFSMHRDITLYILKTKVAPDFLGAYLVLFLSLSKLFWVGSFMLV